VRELMGVPNNYKVMFLQGGASSQFSMIPLNLMNKNKKVDLVMTGLWTQRAYEEVSRYGSAKIVASSEDKNFTYIPELDPDIFTKDADYVHICYNNTVYGTRYTRLPDTGDAPLVADVSSCIMSEPIDMRRFGLLFAGAQKNIGPSGLTVVIVREDLIGKHMDITPLMMQYTTHTSTKSLYNTPSTFSVYMCKLVLEWLKGVGGVSEIVKINEQKAKLLYDALDGSKLFIPSVAKKDRSLMNVTFRTGNEELDTKFCTEAAARGLDGIAGYRATKGMRASIYNAMPLSGVEALVSFMKEFEQNNT